MKIKGSVENLKVNSAFSVTLAGTVIAFCIRLYQVFSGIIDFETGFFTKESITTPILYGVLAVTAVAVLMITFLAGKVPHDKMPAEKSIVTSVMSLVFAVGLVAGAIPLFGEYTEMSSSYNSFLAEQSHFSYLMKSGALPKLAEGFFALISAVYFVILALRFAGLSKINLTKLKAFALSPLFWATFRMIQRFTRTISFMNVSTLFLELFMIAFMMMFFMYFAQMASEVNNRCTSYKVISYGLVAAMLAFVVAVPKLILSLFNEDYKLLEEAGQIACPQEIADVAFIFFAFAFISVVLTSPKVKNMTVKEAEKMIEEEA